MKLHLLPNSQLDPVWLWDWREGLNEGIITCRTMLELMEEFPDLTYIRGESVMGGGERGADSVVAHARRHAGAASPIWSNVGLETSVFI